jgi:hypothetical protein
MAKAKKPDLDEMTLQIAKRILSTPPKLHKDMKLGKSRARARMEIDGVRLWKIISDFIVAPYSQIVPRSTPTSSSRHSRRASGSALLDAEGGKPSLVEK